MIRVELKSEPRILSWKTIREFCHTGLDSLGLIQQIQAESRQRLANNNKPLIHATN